jgi:hypothetical protein
MLVNVISLSPPDTRPCYVMVSVFLTEKKQSTKGGMLVALPRLCIHIYMPINVGIQRENSRVP